MARNEDMTAALQATRVRQLRQAKRGGHFLFGARRKPRRDRPRDERGAPRALPPGAEVPPRRDRGPGLSRGPPGPRRIFGKAFHSADAIALSRATLSKIRQNLFFAFVYNVLGIPRAALGLRNPGIAGAARAASSGSVVSHTWLPNRWKP